MDSHHRQDNNSFYASVLFGANQIWNVCVCLCVCTMHPTFSLSTPRGHEQHVSVINPQHHTEAALHFISFTYVFHRTLGRENHSNQHNVSLSLNIWRLAVRLPTVVLVRDNIKNIMLWYTIHRGWISPGVIGSYFVLYMFLSTVFCFLCV